MASAPSWPLAPLRPLSYDVVYADPPWKFEVWGKTKSRDLKGSRAAERHYPTMSLEEIRALRVGDLLSRNGALFMWILDTHMQQALDLISDWGLVYKKVVFIWVKTGRKSGQPVLGTGYWSRNGGELCLMATTGRPHRLDKAVPQILLEPRRQHSRKPDAFLTRIELLLGPCRRVELFARQRRAGWDAWGNQVDRFAPPQD